MWRVALVVAIVFVLAGCATGGSWVVRGPVTVGGGNFGLCMEVSSPDYEVLAICEDTFTGEETCWIQAPDYVRVPFDSECEKAREVAVSG